MMHQESRPLKGSFVLVVEDEAILAFEIITLLRTAGARVLGPAMSLERALELAEAAGLTCAVLDVRLRDGLVFPAAEALRKRGIGIVFYTGQGDPEEIRRNWPQAKVLLKPAPMEKLILAIISTCKAMQGSGG
jgi:DNA-binding NarL/FixJ family response regulator